MMLTNEYVDVEVLFCAAFVIPSEAKESTANEE